MTRDETNDLNGFAAGTRVDVHQLFHRLGMVEGGAFQGRGKRWIG